MLHTFPHTSSRHRVSTGLAASTLLLAALLASPLAAQSAAEESTAEKPMAERAAWDALESLAPSQIAGDAWLAAPNLVAEAPGAPEQLVWIEGTEPTRSRIRSSRRVGGSWSSPVTVEDFGPGSRTGLHVVRMPGGDLLAAWAAYDGTDDEIHWSRWSLEEGWSSPRALTDDTYPDVTPSLVALNDPVAGGVLLAWSGYDGEDYRISLARWTGDGFEALPGAAGRGAARPRFQTVDGDVFLVWRQAAPRGWGMAAVGETGELTRSALAPITDGPIAEAPRILRETPDGLLLDAGIAVPWSDPSR